MKAGDIVLVDTNVILEAHRVSRWEHLSKNFKIHTVDKVIEETQTGYQKRAKEELIDQKELSSSVALIYSVSDEERIQCMLDASSVSQLDDGEKDLLIYASKLGVGCWLLSSPDTAAMRAAHDQGWLERVVSLESLLEAINCKSDKPLRENYTEKWDVSKKSKIRFGIL